MALAKALIKPEGGDEFSVLFNPTEYSLTGSNKIAATGIPGLGAPILQYVHGEARTLAMDLFFDTYARRHDVSQETDRVYKLLRIDPETHAPWICTFSWKDLQFRCVLEQVKGKFTLFLEDGTPVRATLSVTFKEYKDVRELVGEDPTRSADHAKLYTVRRGDSLSRLAAAEYGDPSRWRAIAEANGIDNPRALEPGRALLIPALKPRESS